MTISLWIFTTVIKIKKKLDRKFEWEKLILINGQNLFKKIVFFVRFPLLYLAQFFFLQKLHQKLVGSKVRGEKTFPLLLSFQCMSFPVHFNSTQCSSSSRSLSLLCLCTYNLSASSSSSWVRDLSPRSRPNYSTSSQTCNRALGTHMQLLRARQTRKLAG